jgi:hypothetical protein
MKRRPTARIFSAVAIVAFAGANGLTASGLHALSHAEETSTGSVAMHDQAAHETAGHHRGDSGHDHGSPEECSCFGTCANVTPTLAPTARAVLADALDTACSGTLSRSTGSLTPRLTEYLFPLPNAPPVRA